MYTRLYIQLMTKKAYQNKRLVLDFKIFNSHQFNGVTRPNEECIHK